MSNVVMVFDYGGSDNPLNNRPMQVHKVMVTDSDMQSLSHLIKTPSAVPGRAVLTSVVESMIRTKHRDMKCIFCRSNSSVTSYHRTKMRQHKDGRLCIENHPLYMCRSLTCMQKGDLLESKLKERFSCNVIDGSDTPKEVRMCVACKQFLNVGMFDDDNWSDFRRRCYVCLLQKSHKGRRFPKSDV